MEVEHVANFRNLQNSAVGHFSSVCGSNFLPISVMIFKFGLDSSCLN